MTNKKSEIKAKSNSKLGLLSDRLGSTKSKPPSGSPKVVELEEKLFEIESVKIPQIIAKRSEAASWGDLSENAGYEQANADLALYQSMARSLKMEIKKLQET